MTFTQAILTPYQNRGRSGYGGNVLWYKEAVKAMKIPLNVDVVEFPLLIAYNSLDQFISEESAPTLMVILACGGVEDDYATLESNFKYAISHRQTNCKLRKIEAKDRNDTIPYLIAYGAVFTEWMQPCMLNTVKLMTEWSEVEGKRKVVDWEPILRLSPICWSLNDSMSRLLTGKYLREIIQSDPLWCYWDGFPRKKIKVEIEEIPFDIISPEAPSILTTNQELLQTAIDHIDEIGL